MNMSSDIDRLRIASPCPVGWEKMTGGDRVRHCDLCSLNVYNIAEMSRADAKALIANTEGRICARLFRRADGTIITKDCPVGLRAIRRRVARVAGAALATVLSLCATVSGQKPKDKDGCQQQVKITKKVSDLSTWDSAVAGSILDPNGIVVSGANLSIVSQKSKKSVDTKSDAKGNFAIPSLPPGAYDITVKAAGFNNVEVKGVTFSAKETLHLEVILIPDEVTVVIGVVGDDWPNTSTSGMIIIRGDVIQKLPIP
jgi:hypothetical protein